MKRLFIILTMLLFADSALASMTVVQHASTATNSGTSLPLAYSQNVAAGDLLLSVVSTGADSSIVPVTDSQGNQYKLAVNDNPGTSGTPAQISIYCAVALASGPDTVTAHLGAANNVHLAIYEIKSSYGAWPAGATDQTGSAAGLTVSAAAATAQPAEYAIAAFAANNTTETWTSGTGYGNAETCNSSGDSLFVEDSVLSAVQKPTASASASNTDHFAAAIATFKEPASGPAGTPLRAKFTFDDGTAVAGSVALFKVASPDILLGTFLLNSSGVATASLVLDATAQYRAALDNPTGVKIVDVLSMPISQMLEAQIISMLATVEIDVVLAKADNSVLSVNPVPLP